MPADQWPLFELVVSEIDDCHYRLHMNLDLLQFDVQSFKVMMDDLAQVWRGETLAPLAITFRDYVMAEQARRRSIGMARCLGLLAGKTAATALSARAAGG